MRIWHLHDFRWLSNEQVSVTHFSDTSAISSQTTCAIVSLEKVLEVNKVDCSC